MANLKSTNLAELGLVSRQLVVSGKHRIFVSSDFSQIEARIATHFSQDKFLINAFKTDKDIFSMLSTDLFRTENITPKIRENAKQIFYGVLYGQGINSLAKELKISKSDCKSIESHFHNQFLSLKRLVQQCYKQSAENGFIKSFLGRKRFFDTKNGENLENGEKMSLKRKAVNSLCQSSAADLLKMALVKIEKERKKVFENSAKLVLLVHDEIVYSVDEQIVELFAKMMKNKMENCAILKNVPLKVTIKTGKNWGQMEKLFKN
ncbi:hypothetical protein MHBO_003431 [Bonamia ostreae]|uniref:DNA-directed DNA polymerase n=1 Tax=Bonamia ostreae TaxID=126728 RepID=A0ABV2AQG7_9EUKA